MAKFAGIGEETTYGTPVSAAEYIDIVSESVNPEHGYIEVETAGYMERRQRVPGPYLVSGSIDFIVNADNITKFLKWLLGSVTTRTDGAGRYEHQFLPSTSFKSFTVEICPEVGTYSRRVQGCVVRSITLEAPARDLVTASVDILGQKDARITATTPTFSTVRPFIFWDGDLTLDGSPIADIEAFSLTVSRDIPDDVHVFGSRFLPDVTKRAQVFSVEGSMDVAFLDWSLWEKFWGSATGPADVPASVGLVFSLTGDATGGTGDFANYKLRAEIPKAYLETSEANVDRRDRIVQSLGFAVVRDPTLGATIEIHVVNKKSTP